jgi:hypothetical protein
MTAHVATDCTEHIGSNHTDKAIRGLILLKPLI